MDDFVLALNHDSLRVQTSQAEPDTDVGGVVGALLHLRAVAWTGARTRLRVKSYGAPVYAEHLSATGGLRESQHQHHSAAKSAPSTRARSTGLPNVQAAAFRAARF